MRDNDFRPSCERAIRWLPGLVEFGVAKDVAEFASSDGEANWATVAFDRWFDRPSSRSHRERVIEYI